MEAYKGYTLHRDPKYCYWYVKTDGKGSVPKMLDGVWATKTLLTSKIDAWRELNPQEVPEAPVKASKAKQELA